MVRGNPLSSRTHREALLKTFPLHVTSDPTNSLHTISCASPQVEQSYLVLFCTHASRLQEHVQGLVLTILVRGPRRWRLGPLGD